MRLLIVRHGDPDYEHDSLTERGFQEAECLAERLAPLPVRAYYVSPLGRAQDTASCTLTRAGRTAVTCEWLREFAPRIDRPDRSDRKTITWDWLPQDWLQYPQFLDADAWTDHPVLRAAGVEAEYAWVTQSLDELLAAYGYERCGRYYRVTEANNDTLVFFCHFGLECVLLSHLMNVSPMVLWHGLAAAPTSVTTVYTEERREGIAYFRTAAIGDISHLYAKGLEPSFSARFCECYANDWERHD